MNWLYRKNIGILAMVFLILFSALTGTHRSLAKLQGKAEAVFTAGEAGDGIGIQSDLNERLALAYNMVTIGRKYLPEGDPLLEQVLAARSQLEAAEGPASKYEANEAMSLAMKDLYDALKGRSLSSVDAPYPDKLYAEFNSRNDTISHDPYNKLAVEFNSVLKAFPANVLGRLVFIRPLELFQ